MSIPPPPSGSGPHDPAAGDAAPEVRTEPAGTPQNARPAGPPATRPGPPGPAPGPGPGAVPKKRYRDAAADPGKTWNDPVLGAELTRAGVWAVFASSDTADERKERYDAKAFFGDYVVRFMDLNDGHGTQHVWCKKLEEDVRAAAAVTGDGPRDTVEPLAGFRNPGHLWLTYETFFNQRPYRKTNQECELGLYLIPMSHVKVFVRDDLDPALLNTLVEAFFPDSDADAIKRLSSSYWPWKDSVAGPKRHHESPATVVASRATNVVHLKQYAVLAFNFLANGHESHAIGKDPTTELGAPLKRLTARWKFWKTASRSVLAKLTPAKKKGEPWKPLLEPPDSAWDLALAPNFNPPDDVIGKTEGGTIDLKSAAQGGTELSLASADQCFSVKTGAQFIGFSDQQITHKDKLEENSVFAILRSDFIVEMDRKAGRDHKASKDIIIQTELLSITELDKSGAVEFGDGIQVRDLSVLDKGKLYFPPLSVPFVGTDLAVLRPRFEGATDPAWCAFWQTNYAEALGRAKAVLLLRYCLQMGSPNAQNMLLEFEPDGKTSTGRVVFRDVGDMYLNREVLWARLGGEGLPPLGEALKTELRKLPSKIIQYEATHLVEDALLDASGQAVEKWRQYVPYETGSLYENEYGPRGTRPLWHRFSTLSKANSVESASKIGTDPDAYTKGWQAVQALMCAWGIAHNKAYTAYLEDKLGLRFGIDWDQSPSPDRYRAMGDTDRAAAAAAYVADRSWEDQAGNRFTEVLASERGQQALRGFRD